MKERNVTITLGKAKEWYNSNNTTLKELALQAFNELELKFDFRNIKSLGDACKVLNLDFDSILSIAKDINKVSKASAAMFKLNIVKKALNLCQDLHLTEHSYTFFPYNPFITKNSTYFKDELDSGKMELIGKIKSKEGEYYVLGGYASFGNYNALGVFDPLSGVGSAHAEVGFLGCASDGIAEHFGRYFGMLITEAKYGDLEDFEIVCSC